MRPGSPLGITVALITQPYRLTPGLGLGALDERSLDAAWRAVWPHVATAGVPMIAGGRSAGSQVACRTAKTLGADALAKVTEAVTTWLEALLPQPRMP